MEAPSLILESRRFRFGRRWILWTSVVAVCILLVVAAEFVKNARREASASNTANQFRHAILDMRSFSGLPSPDGVSGGAMLDVVAENRERLLSWRVWLTDHSLPIPGDGRADYDKSWDDPRNLRTSEKGV